ncbi:hypothetical protein PQG46_03300 [Aquirufa nivalisilvae]
METYLKFCRYKKGDHEFWQLIHNDLDLLVGDLFQYDESYYNMLELSNQLLFKSLRFSLGNYTVTENFIDKWGFRNIYLWPLID